MHYYQFNIGDYVSHTRHLSPIEDIAYRRLLDAYYLSERPLNSGVASVARQVGLKDYENEVNEVLHEYFKLTENGWINSRADKEIAHYKGKIEQASRAGKASAERRINGRSTDVQPTNNHKPLTNNHSIAQSAKDERFEAFWKAYPKKVGKDAAKKSFKVRKVDDSLLTEMMSALSKQKNSEQWQKNGGQFIPLPTTWLNQGRWKDEESSNEYVSINQRLGAI